MRAGSLLLVVVAALEAFAIARWIAREVIASARIAQWSARPEIENWADPYHGAEWLPVAIGAGLVMLLVGWATVLIAIRQPRRVA